jgi:hypothetical protein
MRRTNDSAGRMFSAGGAGTSTARARPVASSALSTTRSRTCCRSGAAACAWRVWRPTMGSAECCSGRCSTGSARSTCPPCGSSWRHEPRQLVEAIKRSDRVEVAISVYSPTVRRCARSPPSAELDLEAATSRQVPHLDEAVAGRGLVFKTRPRYSPKARFCRAFGVSRLALEPDIPGVVVGQRAAT